MMSMVDCLVLMSQSTLRHQTPRKCVTTVCLSFLAALCILFSILFLRKELILGSRSGIPHEDAVPTVCTDESCRLECVSQWDSENEYPIPAIRHIIWKSDSVSEYLAEQLRTWYKIHSNWTFVLWRDQDLDPLVSNNFPGALAKFRSLPKQIMKVDLVRYMILYLYGGVFADLDYTLVRSLDEYRHFYAVITREPEAHSLEFLGMTWPPKLMASPAFMMAAPGHTFFHYAMLAIGARDTKTVLEYGGPIGLSETIDKYRDLFPRARNSMETVYVPPSYSFYPYPENRIRNSNNTYRDIRLKRLLSFCELMAESYAEVWREARRHPELEQYCRDVNNMDSITNKSQPIVAIHDLMKPGAVSDNIGVEFYYKNPKKMRSIIPGLVSGRDLL